MAWMSAAGNALGDTPFFTQSAAAMPTACPMLTQIGMTRKFECARWVPEISRPANSRFSIFRGTKQR